MKSWRHALGKEENATFSIVAVAKWRDRGLLPTVEAVGFNPRPFEVHDSASFKIPYRVLTRILITSA